MNEWLPLSLALLGGALLGAMFFAGLWWTVRRGSTARSPALWFMASMLLRTGFTLAGFYLVGHDDWRRLLLCLSGFVLARAVAVRLLRPAIAAPQSRSTEAADAPHP
jgi:F1F0 ATPase subunit 2